MSIKEKLLLVRQFFKEDNLNTPFKNGVPGEDWYLMFKKRNNLFLKKRKVLKLLEEIETIKNYFTLLEPTIKEFNVKHNSSSIWNLNETSFGTNQSKTKIIRAKNKSCSRTISVPGKQNITALLQKICKWFQKKLSYDYFRNINYHLYL